MIGIGKKDGNYSTFSYFTEVNKGGLELKKEFAERFYSNLPA
jgi:hypothetical protein